MYALLTDPSAWLSLATLAILEIVLGVDNVIFLSILVGRLPKERQRVARISGLALAMVTRIALLLSVTWLATLTAPLVHAFDQDFSGRDFVLGLGGLFLMPILNAAVIDLFWFVFKVSVAVYVMIWVRGTFPRFRYDQLMNIGWKVMIPIGMASIMINALIGLIP